MMRLVVLSDSHGDVASFQMAIKNEPSADAVIFLGDGLTDFEYCENILKDKVTIAVRGNCDRYFPAFNKNEIAVFGGKKIYCTHGDNEQVKFGMGRLREKAKEQGCDIVLFGHTHNPLTEYTDGIYYMNPGSVRQNSYGIVDIMPNGVMCFHKKIVSSY